MWQTKVGNEMTPTFVASVASKKDQRSLVFDKENNEFSVGSTFSESTRNTQVDMSR